MTRETKCVSQPNGTSVLFLSFFVFFSRDISFYDSSEKLNRQIWKKKEGDNVIDQVCFGLEYVLGDQGTRAIATKKLKGEQGLLWKEIKTENQ